MLQDATKEQERSLGLLHPYVDEKREYFAVIQKKLKLEQRKAILVYLRYLHSHNCDIKASIDKVQYSTVH